MNKLRMNKEPANITQLVNNRIRFQINLLETNAFSLKYTKNREYYHVYF